MKVLIADDHHIVRKGLREILLKDRAVKEVSEVDNGYEVIEMTRKQKFDVIILDISMPGMNGLDLAEKVREIRPDMPVILCSGYNKLLNLQKTKEMGVQFINKPIIISDMIRTIRLIFEKGEDAR